MPKLLIRDLRTQEYSQVYEKMRKFTDERSATTADEFWCVQHPAVFTLGANADKKHILVNSVIPVVQSDRGGQITYHGPGQLVIYLLVDLRRKSLGVRKFVQHIEQAVVDLLNSYDIKSEARADAHGVYVNGEKIASLGLRVRGGCSYHGVALNVNLDVTPFSYINPCGFQGLKVTQLKDLGVESNCEKIQNELVMYLSTKLDYKPHEIEIIG